MGKSDHACACYRLLAGNMTAPFAQQSTPTVFACPGRLAQCLQQRCCNKQLLLQVFP